PTSPASRKQSLPTTGPQGGDDMPSAPPRVCARCKAVVPKGQRCTCVAPWEGSTHPHDSGQMQKLRKAKLRANPMCEHPGCRRPAERVDHIVPLAEGGPRYEWSNLQSLCRPHDVQKTTADALRGKRRAR